MYILQTPTIYMLIGQFTIELCNLKMLATQRASSIFIYMLIYKTDLSISWNFICSNVFKANLILASYCIYLLPYSKNGKLDKMISDIWQEAVPDCLIPESRKTNEVSPMISLAFCPDALSEAWSSKSHSKQSTEVSLS